MVVHSCVNGKMDGEAIKQHIGKAQLTLYVLPSSATCLLPCYMNQMVFFCCTSIILYKPDVYGSFYQLISSLRKISCASWPSLMNSVSFRKENQSKWSTVQSKTLVCWIMHDSKVSRFNFTVNSDLLSVSSTFMIQQVGVLNSVILILHRAL